jgi:4'-phosphopantetheinyl transferase
MRWLARGEATIPAGTGWLDEVERRRAAGMRFTKRRTEYLLRRYAGKSAVAAALGLPDDPTTLGRIAVLNRPTGAPFVQVDGEQLGLDVSLTDRAGWAVCLVGPDLGAIGCDLEIVEPRSPGFVADFLTPAEQAMVAQASQRGGPDGWDAAANAVWSAKESALKVLRTGLRADTRTVEVVVPDVGALTAGPASSGEQPGWHPLAVTTRLGELPGWWRRDGVFLLTVVAADASALGEPPEQLPGSAELASATPIHSWLASPVAEAAATEA